MTDNSEVVSTDLFSADCVLYMRATERAVSTMSLKTTRMSHEDLTHVSILFDYMTLYVYHIILLSGITEYRIDDRLRYHIVAL